MSSNSSGYRVRRQLSFQDVPYKGQLFYLDIKLPSLKHKISKRIVDLGGKIESFLSRDLNLILIDGDEQKRNVGDVNKLQNIPLSRGQALLNASKDQKGDSGKNDILHTASLLGVKTQTVKEFVQVSAKYMSQIKSQKKALQKEKEILQGMLPITWDQDKENTFILKVEDNEQTYRPLFKQFDTAPKIACNDYGSPFDVGIVLSKQNDLNQSKKKSARAPAKGGYCESCDHWYKGTLKEHLNSSKHRAFIESVANFSSLEAIASGLPNLKHFTRKFEPNNNQEVLSPRKNNYMELNILENMTETHVVEREENRHDAQKATENESVNLQVHTKSNTDDFRSTQKELDLCSAKTTDNSENQGLSYLDGEEKTAAVHSLAKEKQMTVDGVLQNNLSISLPEPEREKNNSALDSKASGQNIDTFAISGYTNTFNTEKTWSGTRNSCYASAMPTCNSTQRINTVDKQGLSEAHFSSSSWSLGDNGVNNVLTFLQSHCSDIVGTGNAVSGRNSVETVRTEKSFNSKESSIVKGSTISAQSVISNSVSAAAAPDIEQFLKLPSEKGKSTMFPLFDVNLCVDPSNIRSQVGCKKKTDTSNPNQNLAPKSDLIATLPEYSNITDECVSGEIPKADHFGSTHNGRGYEQNCKTPLKKESDEFRDEMMKNVASSGSTWSSIRNWLLPEGQNVNQDGDADKNLDKTLVEDCCSTDLNENSALKKKDESDMRNIFNEDSTAASNNFVATWIKNQKFADSANSEMIQHNTCTENVQQVDNLCTGTEVSAIQKRGTANEDVNMFHEIKDLTHDVMDKNKDVRTESIGGNTEDDLSDCTSISDCTLENFRVDVDKHLDRNDLIERHKENSNMDENSNKNWECMSEKSSLSCHLTDKGIKIEGLLTLKGPAEESTINLDSNKLAAERNMSNIDVSVSNSGQNIKSSIPDLDLCFKNTNNKPASVTQQEILITKNEVKSSSIEVEPPEQEKKLEIRQCHELIRNGTNSKDISVRKQASYTEQKSDVFCFNSQFPVSNFANSQTNSQYNNNMYSPISQPSQFGVENNCSQIQNCSTKAHSTVPYSFAGAIQANMSCNSGKKQITDSQQMKMRNEGFINGDYFNTGILPFETQAIPQGYETSSLQADFNQSFSNSSFYMNSVTDYLNMSSPQQRSSEQVYTSRPFSSYNGYIHTSSLPYSQYPGSTDCSIHNEYLSGQKPKPTVHKRRTQITTKCKRNSSQLPVVSSVSGFGVNNSTHSSSGMSSNRVEPAHSLQSDWYPSSPQSAVSSACLSTIRLEDIAEVNTEYNYSFNQPRLKCARNDSVNPPKSSTSVMSKTQAYRSNLISQHDTVNDIVAHRSQSNCRTYSSPYSAMNERNISQISHNQSSISHLRQISTNHHFSHLNYNSYSSQGIQQSQLNSSQNYTGAFANNRHLNYQAMGTNFGIQSGQSKVETQAVEGYYNDNLLKTNVYGGGLINQENMNPALQMGVYDMTQAGVYNAVQTGATRLRLSKISFNQPQQMQQNDLKSYWNVRKAGDCRLVFSNQIGKRKADDCQSSKTGDYSEYDSFNYHHPNKRRCLIY